MGSCFTENIGARFRQYRFRVLENPHGILFNPASLARAMDAYMLHRVYTAEDLFYANECWNSWDHHSRYSHPDRDTCLAQINAAVSSAHQFLKSAGRLFITLGSAFAYELPENGLPGYRSGVVANCHKIPADRFRRRLLSPGEIIALLDELLQALQRFHPGLRVIFTISPVRHLRDGLVDNNRSKAHLIQAVHAVVEQHPHCWYFPAYELVMDDLRDYRFYAEDMVHPNYAATQYVWEKLVDSCIDAGTRDIMKQVNVLNAARNHKPFNPGSNQHRQFLQTHLDKALDLLARYPWISLEEDIRYFSGKT